MTNPRLFVASMIVALVCVAAPALHAQRLGFVDLQRALNDTTEGQAAKQRLKRMFTKRQTELDKMQKRLKRMEEGLQKQKVVLSEEAFEKRVESYRKAFVELQTTYVQFQRDLSERETKETGRILQRMQKILGDIGERESYTAILEVNEGGVFYFRSSLDLTNELIRLYDEQFPGTGGGGDDEDGGGGTKAKGRSKAAPSKAGGGKAPPEEGGGEKAAPSKAGGEKAAPSKAGGGAKGQPML